MRELLDLYQFKGDDITFVRGSALCALEGKDDAQGEDAARARPRGACRGRSSGPAASRSLAPPQARTRCSR